MNQNHPIPDDWNQDMADFASWAGQRMKKPDELILWRSTKGGLWPLVDHAFIANAVPLWGGTVGYELAVISRTYASTDKIPPGLKALNLQVESKSPGEWIALVIDGDTEASRKLLQLFGALDAWWLGAVLPSHMHDQLVAVATYEPIAIVDRPARLADPLAP